MTIPIDPAASVELTPGDLQGVSRVVVHDHKGRNDLSWDRFIRLKATAEAVRLTGSQTLLDVGGFDGALAYFLEGISIDLVDPVTTGGCTLSLAVGDASYDTVVGVDVLEHIAPDDRARALSEFARAAKKHVILNYPCRDSLEAQKLAYSLTNNRLVKEHVEWELPDTDWVLSELARHGLTGDYRAYGSTAVWLGQFTVLNLIPNAAKTLNRHLVEHYSEEPFSQPLYHLVICSR